MLAFELCAEKEKKDNSFLFSPEGVLFHSTTQEFSPLHLKVALLCSKNLQTDKERESQEENLP